ncbi:MAG: T9SS type A sorting domain-containing protein [Hymenobacteraceae bacterium]|nr:T9SS type A sorting domain-containing protein [Hymenobacteraceae bacterium]MDX5394841.1 T9SS type A sorting domain-containing protein [Hymenobacteraceae bacterium]MDX5510875.1 T9SS type A sorting domain-containing protein [Hymenobacteraceae bacterium]
MQKPFTYLCKAFVLLVLVLASQELLARRHTVTVSDFQFSPQSLTIDVGDTVVWQWQSGVHPVVADNGTDFAAFTSSSATPTAQREFNTAKVVGYHCTAHGAPNNGMFGTITVRQVSGLQRAFPSVQLKAYPNPASGVVRFQLNESKSYKNVTIRISNSIGKVVKEVSVPEFNATTEIAVDLSGLSSGVYFYTFAQKDKVLQTKRLVVRQ